MENKHESEFDDSIPRDRWGRPTLIPEGGRVRLPYTRASSLADFISNKRGLQRWRERYMARGLGIRNDLAMLAGSEDYNTGFGVDDVGENKASGLRLDEIIERAVDAARISEKADYGTVVHRLTESKSRADPMAIGGKVLAADVDSVKRALRGVTVLAEEIFVACDEVMAAGSFDKLVRLPGREKAQCWDLKSGKLHMEGFGVQLAVYANGQIYDNDERFTLESQFGPIDTERAIVGHTAAQTGQTVFYEIDIAKGMEAAKHAAWVRDYQGSAQHGVPLDLDALARRAAIEALHEGIDREAAERIYARFSDVWTNELTVLVNRRIQQSL